MTPRLPTIAAARSSGRRSDPASSQTPPVPPPSTSGTTSERCLSAPTNLAAGRATTSTHTTPLPAVRSRPSNPASSNPTHWAIKSSRDVDRITDWFPGLSRADDKWTKASGASAHARPEVGHGAVWPRGQSLPSQRWMPRNSADAGRWPRSTGIARGILPCPQNTEAAKQRKLRGILNKLTPQNFEKLFWQVKEVNIDNVVALCGVVSQIHGKALTEPIYCEMYATFCFHLAYALPDFIEEKISFKRLLLNICQREFERNIVEEGGEIKQSEAEREEKRIEARRRKLGNILFIGELYKKKILTERIMHECINELLGQYRNPDEEYIEALCKLMSTIGKMIDHSKAKEHMDEYFDTMHNLSTNQNLSSRVRFMLKDTIDLRKNKWQQRRKVEGPKKIEEVHRDAAQERQAEASRLAPGTGISPVTRRGPPVDDGSRGSFILPSPRPRMAGFRGVPPLVRGYGTQDVRLDDRYPFESRTSSAPLLRRPTADDSITLGPQGGLARGVPLADIPSSIGDPRRMVSGQNRYSRPNLIPHNSRRNHGTFF